ncbi:hypothetical protein ACSSS7_002169 [Eimeria intestinalis]
MEDEVAQMLGTSDGARIQQSSPELCAVQTKQIVQETAENLSFCSKRGALKKRLACGWQQPGYRPAAENGMIGRPLEKESNERRSLLCAANDRFAFLRCGCSSINPLLCEGNMTESAMKRGGIAVEARPAKGPLQTHASTTPVGEVGVKGALEAPVKPRSNTVATFLRPQQSLLPENTSDPHRPSSSGLHTSLHHARLHDRRNALRSISPDIKDICARYRPSTSSAMLSVSTASSGSSSGACHRESSLKAARVTGSSHRRLSASARCTGLSYKQGPTGVPDPTKESPVAPMKPGPASTSSMESSSVPPFEAFAMHDPMRPSAQERLESRGADCSKHRSRTPSASVRQGRSSQDFGSNTRDLSALGGRHQTKPRSIAAKDAESLKVGFTVHTERERTAPSSFLVSATRTRESLLVPGEGRAYHLGVQQGELHNRILTVGHAGRADWLAERFLDPQMRTLSLKSNRNFRLHSGERPLDRSPPLVRNSLSTDSFLAPKKETELLEFCLQGTAARQRAARGDPRSVPENLGSISKRLRQDLIQRRADVCGTRTGVLYSYAGYYRRKPVSIVAVGMGAPMMDVLVREASYITEGPLAIVRLGTCTLLDQELRPGSIVVASQGSLGCYTNYAYFDGTAVENLRTQELRPYTITRPCAADPELSRWAVEQ